MARTPGADDMDDVLMQLPRCPDCGVDIVAVDGWAGGGRCENCGRILHDTAVSAGMRFSPVPRVQPEDLWLPSPEPS